MITTKKYPIVIAALCAFSAIIAVWAYPLMPSHMAAHWNISGVADGTMPKFWGLLLMPAMCTILAAVLTLVPGLDPLHANIATFRTAYDRFIVILLGVLIVIQSQIILWNRGMHLSPNRLFPILLGVLFIAIGLLCKQTKRNWFIGIRTPWTLHSDFVWDKTHARCGKLFVVAGIISCVGVFFPSWALAFILVPVLSTTVYSIIYSYILYRHE